MNMQSSNTPGSILLAITVAVASTTVDAGKGNGGGYSSNNGSANGTMHRSGQATGYGYETRNSSQYRHQNQHRNNYDKSWAHENSYMANSGKGQYSDDKHLNAEDFQDWLNQNQSKVQTQNHNQVRNMAQDGL